MVLVCGEGITRHEDFFILLEGCCIGRCWVASTIGLDITRASAKSHCLKRPKPISSGGVRDSMTCFAPGIVAVPCWAIEQTEDVSFQARIG